ncbi:MAG: MarR family transcriptional regulator [Caulobacteraceae bacterium]|nr:MarR family transcriptional regulator [Caulobacteraceae bacterium]
MSSAPVTRHLAYILKQAQHGLRTRMDRELRKLGLSTAQFAVLTTLQELKAASGAELGRRCFVTPQTVTGVIAGLAKAGLVLRSPSARHGRVIEARLSPLGHDVLGRATAIVYAIEEDMLCDLSASDRATLGRLLRLCALRVGVRSPDLDGD